MNSMEFKDWVQSEMNSRDWNIGDLARASGVSRGALANVLRGERKAGVEICNAIAHALKLPPEQVFRKAGLLSGGDLADDRDEELNYIMKLLDGESRDDVLEFARFRLQSRDGKEKFRTPKNTSTTPRS